MLHPPGHEALELSFAHQGSPRVTLKGMMSIIMLMKGRDGALMDRCSEPWVWEIQETGMGKEVG